MKKVIFKLLYSDYIKDSAFWSVVGYIILIIIGLFFLFALIAGIMGLFQKDSSEEETSD